MSRAVMQQALEAMDKATRFMSDSDYKKLNQAIDDLRAALAEPKQKVWCDCGDSIEPDSGAKCGNCVASDSAEPEQEPVCWQWLDTGNYRKKLPADAIPEHWRPLYTAPTPRKPLTRSEVRGLIESAGYENASAAEIDAFISGARHAEAAHGITEENK